MGIESHYYCEKRPIGLYVLFNSLREQVGVVDMGTRWPEFTRCGICAATDLNYVFLVLARLKESLTHRSRWMTALDATSFFLFLRIYYDSLGHVIRVLHEALNPTKKDRWPSRQSFAKQVKWFAQKENDPYFAKYVSCLRAYGFDKSFDRMRDIRNRLKTIATNEEFPPRLTWLSQDWFPLTGNLRSEVGYYLYHCLKFTDFLGDYFLMKFEEKVPIQRMEADHHGYERGFLDVAQIESYKWFNTVSDSPDLE